MNLQDKAGRGYWDRTWEEYPLPDSWAVDSNRLEYYVQRELFAWVSRWLARYGMTGPNTRLVEVGCARSQALPVFAKHLGLSVYGIDYSPNGCDQAVMMLKREGMMGQIVCADVFAVPAHLVGQFDVVVSFGLVEHFSDSTAIVSALARLLKPGGLIFTNIPNMRGITGLAQKAMNRGIYDIHVPLTREQVKAAHEQAGVQVLECDYFLWSNFGVLNLGNAAHKTAAWWTKKIIVAGLARVSRAGWLLERAIGKKLPASMAFSPYINCVGQRRVE